MKTLIIGAKGMLGQELVKVFSYGQVLAWDKEEIDITDKNDVLKKILETKPDLIINAAAYNAVDKAEEDEATANLLNGTAVSYLAQAATIGGAAIIHYSTDYVFDGTNKNGYAEDARPAPLSVYGRSKLLGEKELVRNADKHYLIRTSRLFGPPAASGAAKKSFPDAILDLAKTKKYLDLVDEEYSSPTYAKDLASRTKEIMDKQMPYGIYHAANSGACTWYGFGKKVLEIAKEGAVCRPVSSSAFPRPAKRPAYSELISTKMPPLRSWEEALTEYLNI
ncbi:dTDP-4-dehydrorhamnose reductase [Candidatus Uhrbacteria bacterium]|nr:dTDP-4-dehydrorhamnose reductase [Candidatus Uhrbacteria bacterium]